MLDPYETSLILTYCRNLCAKSAWRLKVHQLDDFLEWGECHGHLPAMDRDALVEEKAALRRLAKSLEKATRNIELHDAPSPTQCMIDELGDSVGLSRLERDVLGALLRYEALEQVTSLFDGFSADLCNLEKPETRRSFAHAIGHPETEVRNALSRSGNLSRLGVIDPENLNYLPPFVKAFLYRQHEQGVRFRDHALGAPQQATHAWEDFHHLGADRQHLLRLLEGVKARPQVGVNILIYGIPGGGKTEFCKTLAQQVGLPLYSIAEERDNGEEPSRRERIGALNITHRLLEEHSDAILLVDEADDILASPTGFFGGMMKSSERSRVFVHRLLEHAPCPTFWVMNSIADIEPSVLRRMTYALEVRTPTTRTRERLWKQMLDRSQIDASPGDIRRLAVELRSPPSIAETAVRSARLCGGGIEDVTRTASSLVRVLNGGSLPIGANRGDIDFDPELFNPSLDVGAIESQAHQLATRPVSFCLYGPPGTGKSAWLRRVAEHMEMEVLQKRASDLLSKWLGETEQRIAEAFEEARSDGTFLIIDEADSLLIERGASRASWENSAVNELLTWMEAHPIPFGCTTNHLAHLDRASLRRFTFRIECRYLDQAQVRKAFIRFFDLPPPRDLDLLDRLTPADFALARRQSHLLSFADDAYRLVQTLSETVAQREGIRRPIGFAA